MDRQERSKLNILAGEMLEESRAVGRDRVYSATGYSRQNISITHQQVRCANLAWALRWRRKLRKGDVVAIVGGSFSGLMLACSIAIADDVIVYIVEKERRLLHRFRDKSQRYLSPNLNSRDLRVRFDPTFARPIYHPAIFAWEAGVASDVAMTWIREFDQYAAKLPIFTLLQSEVLPDAIEEVNGKVTIRLGPRDAVFRPLTVDVLIDATGFGLEANPLKLADYSYWEGGHRLIYDHLPPKSRVLVSGCGDSGIIETMHYAFADFQHAAVENFWPNGAGLEAHLDLGLERINAVLRSPEVERYDFSLISELCWWLDYWWRWQNWNRTDFRPKKSDKAIFAAIEGQLIDRLAIAFPGQPVSKIGFEQRETFALSLPLAAQLAVRLVVGPLIDNAISREIASLMAEVSVAKLLNTRELRRMLRPGVEVILNGLTPTPFTRNLSAYNVWLTKVMMSLPNVRYTQSQIANVESEVNGKSTVTFANGIAEIFDRVVSRYGPDGGRAEGRLAEGALRDPFPGDFLLAVPHYLVPTDEPNTKRYVEPPRDDVKKRALAILRRRGQKLASPVDKKLYRYALLHVEPFPYPTNDARYPDVQSWLSEALRTGHQPAYRD